MAIICRSHRLLFIMAPRTACTAVGDLLCRELAGEYVPGKDVVAPSGRLILPKKHTTVAQLNEHQVLTGDELSQLFKFTTIRNPFDSLVSLYVKKAKTYQPLLSDSTAWVHCVPGYVDDMLFCRDHTFEEWVVRKYEYGLLRRWVRWQRPALSRNYTSGVDFIMRYERLQDDFDEALRRAGIGQLLQIPRLNTTAEKKRDYREYYTTRARRIVERTFAKELQQYGYEF